MAIFAIVALMLIGIGIVLGLVASLVFGILVGLGIVSVSFVVAIRTRRPALGFSVFLALSGICGGIMGGAACAWFAQATFSTRVDGWQMTIWGAMGGAFGGLVVALTLDYLLRYLQRWASTFVVNR